ncbi:DUF4345 domain-containing protein [Shewanella surugensis]|uniref:DUF4345 domain-containing protein n=1 Tax=Shewanella surugensis TaxID=212020 RepID=A0ABT0LHW2_9GAMM|nr:DUF4345 domain-containing protein [Shewanella surugensis]MCL1127286.1 DUF4345 domain-containing protein [Shewanella surugensis]
MFQAKIFLIIAVIGLFPIALSYGVLPETSIPWLYGFSVDTINSINIFRAIMGVYLAVIIFCILGASNKGLTSPALYSLIVFMWGLAVGRATSLIIDGVAHWLLITYMGVEIIFALVGMMVLRKFKQEQAEEDKNQLPEGGNDGEND